MMPAVATARLTLDNTNGKRGSTFCSATPRKGAAAPPNARPLNISIFKRGTLGSAAYLDSNTHGGARNADDVATHTNVRLSSTTGAAAPRLPANGNNMKAKHETSVSPNSNGPTLPSIFCARSAATPT